MEGRFAQIDERFVQMEGRFVQMEGRFAQIDERFRHSAAKSSRQFKWLVGMHVTTIMAFVAAVLAR
jgi:hypothetical protein